MDNINELLKSEYLHLQSTIEGFDNKALTIKAWSITFSLAACGAAFANNATSIFLVAAMASFIFWLLEASWKSFQIAHYDRINEIERYFGGADEKIKPLQISKSWYRSFGKTTRKEIIKIMFWYHVLLPHLIISFIAFILFCLTTFKIIAI